MVLNFLAKMKYLLKYSNFVAYIIALSAPFVKPINEWFRKKTDFYRKNKWKTHIIVKNV